MISRSIIISSVSIVKAEISVGVIYVVWQSICWVHFKFLTRATNINLLLSQELLHSPKHPSCLFLESIINRISKQVDKKFLLKGSPDKHQRLVVINII